MTLIWTQKELDYLTEQYGHIPINQLEIDKNKQAIHLKAKLLGLTTKKQKYIVNANFFGKMTKLSCYWAGYIAADGCIKCDGKVLSFHCGPKDITHLELLKNNIEYSGPIYYYDDGTAELSIHNLELCKSLTKNFNIVARKSLILEPPKLSFDEALSYIVGYLDGDGCISYSGDKLFASFRGTESILNWIKGYFDGIYVGTHYCVSKPIYSCGYWSYTIGGNRAKEILTFLNKIDVPKMSRKWNKINA